MQDRNSRWVRELSTVLAQVQVGGVLIARHEAPLADLRAFRPQQRPRAAAAAQRSRRIRGRAPGRVRRSALQHVRVA
jgi:antitoxin (DNA-binding transcriptional repressor) of toxin-antitoxin stability system